jgi:putative PIN family toxin of toxin-antitoxin system
MKLVVDTNIVVSALIRDSATRKILLDPRISAYVPEHFLGEIEEHRDHIIRKSGLNEKELETILDSVISRLTIVPTEDFLEFMSKAFNVMKGIDEDDAPFIALAISFENDGIWTNDEHFARQRLVPVWKTTDMLKIIE